MTPEEKRAKAREDYAKKKLDPEYMAKKRERDRIAKQRELKNNPEKVRARSKKWRDKNPEKVQEFNKKARERINSIPELKEKDRSRKRVENLTPEQLEKARARKRVENLDSEQLEKRRESGRKYSKKRTSEARDRGTTKYAEEVTEESRNRMTENTRKWRNENPEKAKEAYKKASKTYREKWGDQGKIDTEGMKALRRALFNPDTKSKYFVDFDAEEFREHIRVNMPEGESLISYGFKWEIDHIKPRTSFRYESIDDPQYKECWSLKNLRPMCKYENRKKGNKIN